MKYTNGNCEIEILEDGTRHISFEDKIKLEFPLNIDIRVSTQCDFGWNEKSQSAICSFCHESATTNGKECDYAILFSKLDGLPAGIELAIGSNKLTNNLIEFLSNCNDKGFICNLTINQGHLKRDLKNIQYCISSNLIKGLGISFRKGFANIPVELVEYKNTVVHVINGIDSFVDVVNLSNQGIKKILVLGEKDFGFNRGRVNLKSKSHVEWYQNIRRLFDLFDVVSFDNLALQQLNVKRFLTTSSWDTIYQGEHSMYINAVDGYFSDSSRSFDRTNWDDISLKEFFRGKE